MKILVFTTNFPLLDGGIAPYSYELARGLSAAGHEVVVLTQRYTAKDQAFDEKQTFKIIRVQKQKSSRWEMLYLLFHFMALLITFRPALILPTAWLPCGLLVFPFARILRIRMIITVYAMEIMAPQRRKWTKWIMTEVLKAADRVIAISRYTRDQLLALGVEFDKTLVIPMGIDPKNFLEGDPAQLIEKYQLAGQRVILTLARLVERKGQDIVLKALPRVIERFPNAVYIIAGKGPDEARLKALTSELGVEDYVIFAGYIEDELLPALYRASDVYIMVSRELKDKGDAEGFGITFLEANICGKPVIGGRSGGVLDAIVDGETGILVDPLSLDEVAQALITLLSDQELAQHLGERGRIRAEQEYNWKYLIGQHAKLIEQLYQV